ncbi:MAG: hypothetical protein KAK04_03215, partial [Cyclobacteriaceae bacterium]|nr:hypothetical protein [Cyclobacteriaceae bacterium]
MPSYFTHIKLPVILVYIVVPCIITFNCSNPQKPVAHNTVWQFQSQREDIKPAHWVEQDVLFDGKPTLAISGDGKEYINGCWSYSYEITPGKYYEFITHFKPENVFQLNRSILAQIIWQSEDGKKVDFIEFPATRARRSEGDWYIIQQSYQAPEGAVKAKIDLFYRWDARGRVYFGGTSFEETSEISPRPVRLAAIHHQPRNTASSQENLEQFKEFIDIAGHQEADIVCLP